MNILIIGFNNYNELDRVMNKLIEDSQCYLFNVLVGGTQKANEPTLAEQWAVNNGAPTLRIYEEDMKKLMWLLGNATDYLVMKRAVLRQPVWVKFMQEMKEKGKHGTVID